MVQASGKFQIAIAVFSYLYTIYNYLFKKNIQQNCSSPYCSLLILLVYPDNYHILWFDQQYKQTKKIYKYLKKKKFSPRSFFLKFEQNLFLTIKLLKFKESLPFQMIQWHTIQALITNLQQYLQLIFNIYSHQKMEKTIELPQVKNQEKYHKKHLKKKKSSSQSQQFQLEYHQIKKLGYGINKSKLTIGSWSPEQNLTYLKFLMQNKQDFGSESERRKKKVFYRLSKIIKKRTPDQCRSHHQKLQMKFQDDVEAIIQNIKNKLVKKNLNVQERFNANQASSKTVTKTLEKTGQVKIEEPQAVNQQFYKVFYCPGVLKLQINIQNISVWP